MTVETDNQLSRREATLRSAALTSLAGIALIQAIQLPPLFTEGRQLGVVALAAMAICIALGLALAALSASVTRQLWRVVGGTAAVILLGWVATHAFAVPGLESDRGSWATMPGLLTGLLAAVCLVVAAIAAPPGRAELRGLAIGAGVAVALTPAIAIALVALGPGTAGGETVLASGGHLHSHGSVENSIVFQPLPGGEGGQYVFKTTAVPHHSPFAIALMAAAAFIFIYGAVGYLRRRSAPAEEQQSSLAGLDLNGGLA
jgi:hypothetical protein